MNYKSFLFTLLFVSSIIFSKTIVANELQFSNMENVVPTETVQVYVLEVNNINDHLKQVLEQHSKIRSIANEGSKMKVIADTSFTLDQLSKVFESVGLDFQLLDSFRAEIKL